jgi:hypothetical protein
MAVFGDTVEPLVQLQATGCASGGKIGQR